MTILLTPEPRALVLRTRAAYARSSAGFWIVYLGPFCAFALYGVVLRDGVALAIAFAALAGVLAWLLARMQRNLPRWRSILDKLLDASGTPTQPESQP